MEFNYFNDGKEKYQSHEVSLSYEGMYIIGYGQNKEEAYNEFIKIFDEKIKEINAFRLKISIKDI